MMEKIRQIFNKIKNTKFLFFSWWLILLLVLILPNYSYYADSDEGLVLAGAWNLFNGQKIFSDFFSFIPPGSYYFVLLIWKIFAPNYLLTKLFSLLLIYSSAFGVYKIARTFGEKYTLLAPTLFILSSFSWQPINHNTYNIFFIIWSAYFFIKAIQNNRTVNCAASGILLGTAILFLQQKSLLVILLFSSWLVGLAAIEKTKKSWVNLSAFLLAIILPASLLLLFAPIKTLYNNLFLFPLHNYTDSNRMPFTLLVIILTLTITIFYLTIRKQGTKVLFFLFLLQLTLLASALPRPDWLHLSIVLFPTLTLGPIVFQQKKITTLPEFLSKTSFLLITCIIALTASIFFALFPPLHFFDKSALVKYIEANCQESKYLYAGPYAPSFYLATKKLPATPFLFLITNQQTTEQFAVAAAYLEKNRPQCAVLNYSVVEKFKYDKNNMVDKYLANNYDVAEIFDDNIILKIHQQ